MNKRKSLKELNLLDKFLFDEAMDKEKIIESFSRGSAVDYEFGKWKFEKGVFVQKELLSHSPRECE